MAQEFEQVDGVEEGVEESTAPATADSTQDGQPNGTDRRIVQSEQTKQKINLDEYPEFRRFKSEYDRKLAETERRYQAMLAQQEQQLRAKQFAEMDDYQRIEWERNEALAREQAAQQRLQEYEVVQRKNQVLQRISRVTGVPVEELQDAQDFEDALELAAMKRQTIEERRAEQLRLEGERRAAERAAKQANNRVDVGRGTSTPTTDWDKQYEQFRQRKDPWSMFQHALGERQG